MTDPKPTTDDILNFQNLVLLRIYDAQMHMLREMNPNVAKQLEALHLKHEFGVEVD